MSGIHTHYGQVHLSDKQGTHAGFQSIVNATTYGVTFVIDRRPFYIDHIQQRTASDTTDIPAITAIGIRRFFLTECCCESLENETGWQASRHRYKDYRPDYQPRRM